MTALKGVGWTANCSPISPGAGEVHIWIIPLWSISINGHGGRSTLSEEEVAKADRFCLEKDRLTYIYVRGILRSLLGRITGRSPRELLLVQNQYGKPALSPHQNTQNIEFNVSHSADFALLAFSRGARVGVDVEKMRPNLGFLQMAQAILSPQQYSQFLALPTSLRQRAFYRCWAQKEAFSKAIGRGMSLPYDSFDIAFLAGETPQLLRLDPGLTERAPWSLSELHVDAGYAAALAVATDSPRILFWHWDSHHLS